MESLNIYTISMYYTWSNSGFTHTNPRRPEKVKTPVTVTDGTWEGHVWRRARKSYLCDYNKRGGVWCTNQIEAGDVYLEGQMNPYKAGGFGNYRYCQLCAGADARAALALAAGQQRGAD